LVKEKLRKVRARDLEDQEVKREDNNKLMNRKTIMMIWII